ncbi:outer membrane beta-barrel protein [Pseudomonas sp. J452]|uniref:OmpW/AlkL family protein n=1 Tax=Pseudomonas sp. J452 TaxID=2898441 RepID=UPI0021AE2D5E|nr:OmpW family outer membrane protein [Pseudomonas sp. J452]UUY08870.1 outer membrane beta-barrel protein [Pseudomonas sp. J452]
MRKSLLTASLLALAVSAPLAQAFEAGDIIVRAGAITVAPVEDSSELQVGGADVAGTKATVESDTQLGLNFAYMVTNNIGIELLAASPFTHEVGVRGVDAALGTPAGTIDGRLGETKQLPPTLSAIYYPLDSQSAFQPYLGLGINYTVMFDEDLSSRQEANGFSNLDIDDSWGLSYQVGMDYMLSDNLLLNAQVRYIDIDVTATLDHNTLGDVEVDVDIDPFVYMIGLGYKF